MVEMTNFVPDDLRQQKCLRGKTAIITGASRGIGREVLQYIPSIFKANKTSQIALTFAQAGANVVVAAKSVQDTPNLPGTIYSVAKEVESYGVRALPCQVDVRDDVAVEKMVEKTLQTFGTIDILIANSGVSTVCKETGLQTLRYLLGFMVEKCSGYSYEKI